MMSQPTLEQIREELRVSEEFLARYNRPGPRYTSYPTAPVWNDAFGPADLEVAHERANAANTPVSLYMHLPFCESLCLFCACNVIIQKDKQVSLRYFEVLKKEIARVSESVSHGREVVQFHWGGGTPTYSTPAQLEDLFGYTKHRFAFSQDAEIGIEVDPRVTTREHLEMLRRAGFNRLSMGIQDFHEAVQLAISADAESGIGVDPRVTPREHLEMLRRAGFNRLSMGIQDFHEPVQLAIHRVQPYDTPRDLFKTARELGFDSINVDLIYGLPYQTAETFAQTVDRR